MTSPTAIATWARHQLALSALRSTLGVLEPAGIPVLVVKGMVLAHLLYADIADRPMCDVDLRVRPRDFLRAVRAMRASGSKPLWVSRQFGAVSFEVEGTLIEIETSVGPPGLCALSVARMLERSRERLLPGDLRVREPEIHDHAMVMLINAYKDKMVRCPSWSLDDLDAIVAHLDPETFLVRIAEARVRTLAWIAADWMARERASDRWRGLRERMGARAPRRLYAWAVRRSLQQAPTSVTLRALTRMASDSALQRVWALAAGGAGSAISWVGSGLETLS